MHDDLITRLRALSRHEHSDMTIGDEAADALLDTISDRDSWVQYASMITDDVVAFATRLDPERANMKAERDRHANELSAALGWPGGISTPELHWPTLLRMVFKLRTKNMANNPTLDRAE